MASLGGVIGPMPGTAVSPGAVSPGWSVPGPGTKDSSASPPAFWEPLPDAEPEEDGLPVAPELVEPPVPEELSDGVELESPALIGGGVGSDGALGGADTGRLSLARPIRASPVTQTGV